MTAVFMLLGFFLVAGLFLYLTVLDAGRWRKKIEAALLPMGFEICLSSEEKAVLEQRLLIVNPRHQGKRLLMHLYRRVSADDSHNLYFCDYRFASASGKSRGVQLLLICLISSELDLPRVSIVSIPETLGIAGKLFHSLSESFAVPGLKQIKTGNAEFDEHFCVHVDYGKVNQVLPLLERITTTLQAKGDACLDAQGDSLILSSIEMGADLVRHELDSQKLLELIRVTSSLFKTVRH
jgi:hypothetical protein